MRVRGVLFGLYHIVAFTLLLLGYARLHAVTNDLRITSITHITNGCTTLTWISHTGEFYTVYSTTNLCPPIFWQVAEVNVPSQGTNTTWSEGDCGEMMMGGQFFQQRHEWNDRSGNRGLNRLPAGRGIE